MITIGEHSLYVYMQDVQYKLDYRTNWKCAECAAIVLFTIALQCVQSCSYAGKEWVWAKL